MLPLLRPVVNINLYFLMKNKVAYILTHKAAEAVTHKDNRAVVLLA